MIDSQQLIIKHTKINPTLGNFFILNIGCKGWENNANLNMLIPKSKSRCIRRFALTNILNSKYF